MINEFAYRVFLRKLSRINSFTHTREIHKSYTNETKFIFSLSKTFKFHCAHYPFSLAWILFEELQQMNEQTQNIHISWLLIYRMVLLVSVKNLNMSNKEKKNICCLVSKFLFVRIKSQIIFLFVLLVLWRIYHGNLLDSSFYQSDDVKGNLYHESYS